MTWELTGVPYTSAARPGGIAEAITVLRAGGLAARLGVLGVSDGGDLDLEPPNGRRGSSGLLNEAALTRLVEASAERVQATRERGHRALMVGGDCPILLGALAALRAAGDQPGLVMLDGHEDAWPPHLSPTGEASDSEVAIALGLTGVELPPPLADLTPLVQPNAVVLLGPRDREEIEAGGAQSLRDLVAYFADPARLRNDGVRAAMTDALDAIDRSSFWLHVDLDVLATDAFAAVDYPQTGGLEWFELDQLTAVATADPRCVGASIAIYNPVHDVHGSGSEAVTAFVCRLVS